MAVMRDIVSYVYKTPEGEEKRISLRSLERYVQAYRTGGWEALKPSPRADKLASREIPEDVLAKAKGCGVTAWQKSAVRYYFRKHYQVHIRAYGLVTFPLPFTFAVIFLRDPKILLDGLSLAACSS